MNKYTTAGIKSCRSRPSFPQIYNYFNGIDCKKMFSRELMWKKSALVPFCYSMCSCMFLQNCWWEAPPFPESCKGYRWVSLAGPGKPWRLAPKFGKVGPSFQSFQASHSLRLCRAYLLEVLGPTHPCLWLWPLLVGQAVPGRRRGPEGPKERSPFLEPSLTPQMDRNSASSAREDHCRSL